MDGHGELAVIHTHQLYLIGGPVSGVHYVGFGNSADKPQWSYDGKWLSVVVTPPPPKSRPFADEPSKVWLVTPAGKVVRVASPTGLDTYDVSVAWSPTSDRLAIAYSLHRKNPKNDRDVLEVVDATNGASDGLVTAPYISGFAWSPNGRRLAVATNRFAGTPGAWRSRLVTFDAKTDAQHLVTTASRNVLEVAGWWPDGSGILTWLDYQGSASLAADGLPLLDISVSTGHRRQLARSMLQYPQWLATSQKTNQIAFVAGGAREVTQGHKHLEVCGPTACHALAQGSKQVSFDPAWSTTGRLAFVRDQAINPNQGCCATAYVNKIQASGGIKTGATTSAVRAFPGGDGASAPTWGSDGSMLVVRDSALWLITPDGSGSGKVVDGLQVTYRNSYYGFVGWHDSFAWTDAASG
jgi:Tol biopolymer transport system component